MTPSRNDLFNFNQTTNVVIIIEGGCGFRGAPPLSKEHFGQKPATMSTHPLF
jgi:hypothetical protein